MVSQSSSEVNTTFVVAEKDGPRAVESLQNDPYFTQWFEVTSQAVSIIAVVGKAIPNSAIKARIYKALGMKAINSIAVAQSSDGMNVSICIEREQLKEAVVAIYEEFKIRESV
jgi:aspartokinase